MDCWTMSQAHQYNYADQRRSTLKQGKKQQRRDEVEERRRKGNNLQGQRRHDEVKLQARGSWRERQGVNGVRQGAVGR